MTSRPSLPGLVAGALSAAFLGLCLAAVPSTAAQTTPPPRILAMEISKLAFQPGETVHGHVVTTADVTSVEIHVGFWGMPLVHPRTGYFEGSGTIPYLPFFLKGHWTIHVIARNADGIRTERDLRITIR